MPHLRIETNIAREKIPANFLKTTVSLIAQYLKKPESYCVVSVHPDTLMSWGGTDDPCGIARVMSIGGIGKEKNDKLADLLHTHINDNLGIEMNRLYIEYVDQDAAELSYKGETFRKIFG